MTDLAELLVAPLDSARGALLRRVARLAPRIAVGRSERAAVLASVLVVAGLCAALLVPLWMVALAPLLWGVPHVLSDLRYLVARPGLHRRAALLPAAGLVVAAGLGFGALGACLAAVTAALVARGAWGRRLAVAAVGAALAGGCVLLGRRTSDALFLHAHNAIGVALYVAMRRPGSRATLLPLALAVAVALALGLGAFDGWLASAASITAPFGDVDFAYARWLLAPDVGPAAATRLVVLFAFAQAVHYAVWLRLVPEDARRSATPRSFRQSLRALRRDLGPFVLGASALVAVGLLAFAFVSVRSACEAYLWSAFFHAPLEVAAAALFAVEGRRFADAPT